MSYVALQKSTLMQGDGRGGEIGPDNSSSRERVASFIPLKTRCTQDK